jgi:hypothetical protein
MPKYVLAYHGGSVPDPEQETEVMNAWFSWFGELGDAIVDGGNPIGSAKTIRPDGTVTEGGGSEPLSGYSIINATDIQAAVELARGCPVLTAGGSIEVAEAIDI